MMNNYIKQTQYFLLQLIDLYSRISDLLKKIPIPSDSKTQTLLSLTETITACNCIDRGIKRQHQLRLFRETHALLSQYLQKPQKVKKIDIVIKFSLVSQVLTNRLKEQLLTSEELKSQILSQIEDEKQQFLKWAEQKKENNLIKQKKKQTDNYVLKFVFTDLKPSNQPPEPAIAQPNSQDMSTQENMFTRRSPTKRHLYSAITASKVHKSSSRLIRQSVRRITEQRKTIGLERPTFPTAKRKQCKNTQQELASDCQVVSRDTLINIVIPSEDQAEVEQNKLNIQQFKFKKKSKYLTIDSNFGNKDSEGQEENKEPNSEFYVSQRYLKSRKTIESAGHYSYKIKKRSGFNLTTDVVQCQSSRQQQLQQEEMIFRPSNFKPRQQPYPRFPKQNSTLSKAKSEKNIEKNNTQQQAILHNKVLRRSQRLGTKGKRRSSLRSKTSMMSSNAQKETLPFKKSQFFNLSSLKIDGEASVPNDERREEKPLQSNIKSYYNQLSSMRGDIISSCDSWLKDFSVFFWHQTLLYEENNRSIQKILANRKCSYPIGQFDLRLETSQRPISAAGSAHEDAFVHAMRNHLSECQELGQGGPQSD